MIGEIGCSYPLKDSEKRALQAAAMAQTRTGDLRPLSIPTCMYCDLFHLKVYILLPKQSCSNLLSKIRKGGGDGGGGAIVFCVHVLNYKLFPLCVETTLILSFHTQGLPSSSILVETTSLLLISSPSWSRLVPASTARSCLTWTGASKTRRSCWSLPSLAVSWSMTSLEWSAHTTR